MYVIPLVLTEDMVKKLPDEILAMLSACSTPVSLRVVGKYLSDKNNDPSVAARVAMAYAGTVSTAEFLHSSETKGTVERLLNYTYDDVSPLKTEEELESMLTDIDYVLRSDKSIPYISPVSKTHLEELFVGLDMYLTEMQRIYGDSEYLADIAIFKKNLVKYKSYFKDTPHARSKGTIVKQVVRQQSKYLVMRRGIEWLLEAKRTRLSPMEWRLF